MADKDVFAGVWRFNPVTSQLSAPPRSWIQTITVNQDSIEVREDIVRADGSNATVRLRAKFDGREYPVNGSAVVDAIAYTREGNRIVGTGTKAGKISLRETMTADHVQMITDVAIYLNDRQVVSGFAVFDKISAEAGSASHGR